MGKKGSIPHEAWLPHVGQPTSPIRPQQWHMTGEYHASRFQYLEPVMTTVSIYVKLKKMCLEGEVQNIDGGEAD